ncbi:transmembrane protein 70, mitochondrial [Betta splendens]|uniref:Transmembrane protein 70, mitochondrial n=1 Tax=Betta splendens TaxID=158456 RepID=A0A6P7L2I1_BETSP|nr:transmembrane protein 70, mitochondrial [Betta splendens]
MWKVACYACKYDIMFSAHILRRLGPCAVHVHTTARHGVSAICFRRISGKQLIQLQPVTRSFLFNNKSLCPATCSMSTVTPPEEGNLIYTGSLGTAVRGVKFFSYSTSGASLLLMPQILLKTGLGVQSFAMQATCCAILGFFTFIMPVLLHLVTRGYVVRLYHNPDTDSYTAITYSVFLTKKKTVFHQSQVRIPDVSKMFTTFYANNVGLLVNPDLFTIPNDYNHLMGYDKPFSFNADDVDRPEKF